MEYIVKITIDIPKEQEERIKNLFHTLHGHYDIDKSVKDLFESVIMDIEKGVIQGVKNKEFDDAVKNIPKIF